MRRAAIVLSLCLVATAAGAQRRDTVDRVARFVAEARATTERFKDLDVAIAERYVKIGPDFPAMGEHWVKGESVMESADSLRPSILTYLVIDGRPVLTGVVYTKILQPGEKNPEALPGAQWHDHVGTVDEESLLFGHDHAAPPDGLRLAVMHAWVWTPNPAGMFATDNWDLPFTRVGLVRPAGASARAARAVALLSSTSYYARLFNAVGELDDRESDAVLDVLERGRDKAQSWIDARKATDPISPQDVAHLETIWTDVIDSVRKSVRPASAARLRAVLNQ